MPGQVFFFDKSKLMLFSNDGIRYVRLSVGDRLNPKHQLHTAKHGGGIILIWGMF